jgi:hypothetical protein
MEGAPRPARNGVRGSSGGLGTISRLISGDLSVGSFEITPVKRRPRKQATLTVCRRGVDLDSESRSGGGDRITAGSLEAHRRGEPGTFAHLFPKIMSPTGLSDRRVACTRVLFGPTSRRPTIRPSGQDCYALRFSKMYVRGIGLERQATLRLWGTALGPLVSNLSYEVCDQPCQRRPNRSSSLRRDGSGCSATIFSDRCCS